MREVDRERLESAGWAVGDAAAFLKLTAAEARHLERRVQLGDSLRERRLARRLSRAEGDHLLGSSQSR